VGGPRAARVRAHAEQMGPAGAVLDRGQRGEPSENMVSPGTKSTATTALACAVRNWRQLGPDRRGAGSRPASREDLPYGGGGDAMGRAGPVRPARAGVPNGDSRWPCERTSVVIPAAVGRAPGWRRAV